MPTPTRATILQPDPDVPVDRFGPWLASNRVLVRAVPLWERPIPSVDSVGDGVILLGGSMSAHDHETHEWITPLKQFVVDLVEAGIPLLGICLGHQILAEAFGGTVVVNDPAGGEHGSQEIYWTGAARTDPLVSRLALGSSSIFAESHSDVVTELPSEARLLASSTLYRNQAFRLGSAVGVQFHPEASPDLMARWAEMDGMSGREMRRHLNTIDTDLSRNGRLLAHSFSNHLQARHAQAA
ncbi:MAG TPA: type 1 glutamine amidotransferase [Propionicimonas sp.]|jgi:GMP synthase (glutamine-hydrolysing)|nr:type 1 glutamine amidotransferase [Propionicimonas sp.]